MGPEPAWPPAKASRSFATCNGHATGGPEGPPCRVVTGYFLATLVVLRAAVLRAGALRAVVLRAAVLRAGAFLAAALRAGAFLAAALRAGAFLAAALRAGAFLAAVLRAV